MAGDVIHNHYYGEKPPASAAKMAEIDPNAARFNVVKAAEEQRFTLGVAYPALKADVALAADGHIDFVSAEVLEKAAWSWMAKNRNVGLSHRDGTEGHGTVVESYIWRADPWVVKSADGSEQTVMPGDWCIGVQWGEDTWQMIKSGLVRGFSPQGAARRRVASGSDLVKLRT